MIIKVQSPVNENSWRFYDNARQVHSFVGSKESMTQGVVSDEVIEDWFEDTDKASDEHSSSEYVCVSFIGDDGAPHHVFSNTRCYLMTDDGKTIERLI